MTYISSFINRNSLCLSTIKITHNFKCDHFQLRFGNLKTRAKKIRIKESTISGDWFHLVTETG